ncbi:MAG: lactate utilization protein C [Alphaproteobacteria bacterium]|nr:lactate utilization protein C [Alphaproteobacteria bacterium]
MSARDDILGSVRRSLRRDRLSDEAQAALQRRIRAHERNIVPQRGSGSGAEIAARFIDEAKSVAVTVQPVASDAEVPDAIVRYLAQHNLPARVAMAPSAALEQIPWASRPTLEVRRGAARPDDQVSVTPAFAGIAETGTLMLTSGAETPTTLNLLPYDHVVVMRTSQIVGSYEDAWDLLRQSRSRADGLIDMPRTVNFITGPSRTGDIEQKILMGAHGPRRLHIVLIEDA